MFGQRELVERARRGDHDAFAALAAARIESMVRLARMICGSTDAAEDATQEAIIAAWRGVPRLRDPDRFDAWLRRLLVRSCRRQARRSMAVGYAVDLWADAAPDETSRIVQRDEIARAFQRMPADQRAALVLRYYEDLPVAEVAIALEVPEGTAKSRIHRGLSALRAVLESDARRTHAEVEGA